MKGWTRVAVLLLVSVATGCAAGGGGSSPAPDCPEVAVSPDAVAARFDGTEITYGELQRLAAGDLARLKQSRFDFLQYRLDEMVTERLLEREAADRGISVEALLVAEVDDKIVAPTDAEVQAHYERNKAAMARGRSLAEVRHFVVNELNRPKLEERRKAFFAELQARAGYVSLLEPPRFDVPVPDDAPARGPASAPVTLVEFSDYQCPFCRKAHETVQRLLAEYGDRVRYVHRDFPMDVHPRARPAALAAHCAADQGRYWEYYDHLMTRPGDMGHRDLEGRAAEVGLDLPAFRACFEEARHEDAIQRGVDDGMRLGVTGTPTFFINGRLLFGAKPYETFRAAIEAELK